MNETEINMRKILKNMDMNLKMLTSYIESLEESKEELQQKILILEAQLKGTSPEQDYNIDYIIAGEWKSKKDQIQILKSSLIKLAVDAKGNDILMESVLQRAKEMGVPESHAKELLKMIHQKGGYLNKRVGYIYPILEKLDTIY